MRIGIIGKLFPLLFSKVVYEYTAAAVPELDLGEFKEKHKKEYEAMVKRTPSVGSMKDNMFAPVMYLACYGFSYYKADPEHITMDVFDGMIEAICRSDMMKRFYQGKNCFDPKEIDKYIRGSKRSKKREYPMDWVFDFSCDLSVPEYYVTHRECGVCKIGRQENLEFLTPHMCVMDYPTIEYKGGKLIRTKTLSTGGDCCDFHVVKGDKLMKYAGMPSGMWAMFAGSFRKQLSEVFGYDAQTAKTVTEKAKRNYKEIIGRLPEFEKGDRFEMNIVSCAMLSAFLLNLRERPSVDQAAEYYRLSMMTLPMKWFCRMSGKRKFSEKDLQDMKETAALKAADRNPYSWNMEFLPYPDGSGYEARFTHCGICTLMKELGLFDLVPAMCRLDYTMSEAGNVSEFVREYTLASGGPYCDCGYRKKDHK